jgi:tight adherence protein B
MMTIDLVIVLLSVLVAAALLVSGGYTLWVSVKGAEVQRLKRRLRTLSAGQQGRVAMVLEKQRAMSATPWIEWLLVNIPRVSTLDRWLHQSGMAVPVGRFFGLSVLCGVLTLLLLLVLRITSWHLTVSGSLLACLVPALVIGRARSNRLRAFDEQLPDAMEFISRALRAGHSFSAAMSMASTEMKDPLGSEFGITLEEINYGVPTNDALRNLTARVPSVDLSYFVVSIMVQRETGGNLSSLLDSLSAMIRARFKLQDRVKVLSAEGKFSAYLMTALPFGTGALIHLANPGFLSVLFTDPAGLMMVGGAILLMILGGLWMSIVIRIRV